LEGTPGFLGRFDGWDPMDKCGFEWEWMGCGSL